MPTVGVGSDGPLDGFVVEADVSADDGDVESAAGIGHAANGLLELPRNRSAFRIAEVQAVGDCQRARAHTREIARCFNNGERATCTYGVQVAGAGD